jgi:hypothetical protein
MHNNAWRYYRSDTAGGTPTNHSADLPDQGIGVTYPVLTTAPNGDLFLAESGGGRVLVVIAISAGNQAGRAGSRHGHPLLNVRDNKAERTVDALAACQLLEDSTEIRAAALSSTLRGSRGGSDAVRRGAGRLAV